MRAILAVPGNTGLRTVRREHDRSTTLRARCRPLSPPPARRTRSRRCGGPVRLRFGSNLARARERRWLSQSQLARRVEVVDNYISRIETGRAEPSFRLALALANQLGVPAAELFDGIA